MALIDSNKREKKPQGEEEIEQAHSSNAWGRIGSWNGVVPSGEDGPCMNCWAEANAYPHSSGPSHAWGSSVGQELTTQCMMHEDSPDLEEVDTGELCFRCGAYASTSL